jgi:cytochrome c biogenesis protein CcmG, thiol:disulfide interchange protein DsbE
MTVRQQWYLVLGIVALLGGGLVAATRFMGDELFPVSVGSPAPDFRAATLDAAAARTKTLADYRGQVVLLNVWATWCGPCRVEMPSIEALHRAYAPQGLKVVAVSIDDAGQEQTVRDFVRELGLTFEILHDPSGAIQKSYQTTGVPETFVLGPDGVIRKKLIGAADWNSPANRALIAQLLADTGR